MTGRRTAEAEITRAIGDAFSGAIRASMGNSPHPHAAAHAEYDYYRELYIRTGSDDARRFMIDAVRLDADN